MPLITKPDPLPSELTYVPEDSKPHTVATGESWWTLAELPQVQAAHKSASDLCYLNFKTRDPREINWYLYHKVGCRLVTHDGKNYMFSDRDRWNKEAATPGIVYLPPVGAVLPVITPTADELRLDIWVGLGGKAGTMVAVAGIETMEGLVVGLDQPHTWMALQASINRARRRLGRHGRGLPDRGDRSASAFATQRISDGRQGLHPRVRGEVGQYRKGSRFRQEVRAHH